MNTKPKILVILGPTASGKSDLGVRLAKKFHGEVISADSRQVYRGMDIGSGKITKKEMLGIHHHLLDIVNPKKTYSVAEYQKTAHQVIADILSRSKLPIIVGGTGLYVQSIVDNISIPEVPPDVKLRRELESKSTSELFKILVKIDPKRAQEIDAKNPRRLVRAIEIAKYLGQVPVLKKDQKYDTLQIGLNIESPRLEQNINTRLLARLKEGMIAEIKRLHEDGVSWKKLEGFGLEYRHIALFLQKKMTREEMISSLLRETIQYAKRQMTWFNKDKRIIWITKPSDANKLVTDFLKST